MAITVNDVAIYKRVSSDSRYDIPGGIANQYVKQINVKSN